MTDTIFQQFCKYVDETIFSIDNVGETVSFMADSVFVKEFCDKQNISEKALMISVKSNLNNYVSPSQAKGILAIQIYAATKREISGGVTERNYRDRLSQLLNWDMTDLQKWMTENQDKYWRTLYTWCKEREFNIAKCHPKEGKGRYVQYPIQQAQRLFTEEDLKRISYHFIEKKIYPNEDIIERDFWRILGKNNLDRYVHTNHGRELVANDEYRTDAFRQIYNYYLRWDGSYIEPSQNNVNKTKKIEKDILTLFLPDNFETLLVCDENIRVQKKLQLKELRKDALNKYYRFKREGMILFKQNDLYENYWEETRYLEDGEDGILLVFNENRTYRFSNSHLLDFSRLDQIAAFSFLKLYRITKEQKTSGLYTEKRFYRLEGGLKVGRMKYICDGTPYLVIDKASKFWIDGKLNDKEMSDGKLLLDFLNIGKHSIKFPCHKKLEFEIVTSKIKESTWKDYFYKWVMSRKDNNWKSTTAEDGIVGLNFSCIKMSFKTIPQTSALTRWGKMHQLGYTSKDEDNISIKILSNINK